jgi:hypothetical protein
VSNEETKSSWQSFRDFEDLSLKDKKRIQGLLEQQMRRGSGISQDDAAKLSHLRPILESKIKKHELADALGELIQAIK